MVKKLLKILALILVILFFGFTGFTFYFADLGRGETWFTRNAIAFGYYFILGAICAFLASPNRIVPYLLLWMVYLAAFLNLPGALFRGESSLVEFFIMLTVPGLAVICSVNVVKYLLQSAKKT